MDDSEVSFWYLLRIGYEFIQVLKHELVSFYCFAYLCKIFIKNTMWLNTFYGEFWRLRISKKTEKVL